MTITAHARVIVAYGSQCLVETAVGELIDCKSRRKAGRAVCADQVQFSRQQGRGAILESVQPRRNSFPRADRHGRKRIVAANLDQIVIVVAPSPQPTRDLINRYLVAANSVAIPAAICLNKDDLIGDDEDRLWNERARIYAKLNIPFCRCNTRAGGGLAALQEILTGGTAILVGQSGVGKSSIINHLVPDLKLRTREISKSTAKGRHTTTATTLYQRADGGDLIDSPGVWEYGIWKMDAGEIAAGFREFGAFIGHCRFSNCKHLVEPGCAIEAAAESGQIAAARLASYRRIVTVNDQAN